VNGIQVTEREVKDSVHTASKASHSKNTNKENGITLNKEDSLQIKKTKQTNMQTSGKQVVR
jgi:hypothetical protein